MSSHKFNLFLSFYSTNVLKNLISNSTWIGSVITIPNRVDIVKDISQFLTFSSVMSMALNVIKQMDDSIAVKETRYKISLNHQGNKNVFLILEFISLFFPADFLVANVFWRVFLSLTDLDCRLLVRLYNWTSKKTGR